MSRQGMEAGGGKGSNVEEERSEIGVEKQEGGGRVCVFVYVWKSGKEERMKRKKSKERKKRDGKEREEERGD